jgi:predicted secreted protein
MKLFVVLSLGLSLLSAAAGAEQKPIAVAKAQEFKIALESNPSTGNQWLLARPLDESLLKLLGTEYKRGRPGAAGSNGHEVLTFKALGEGKTQIHLKYGRLFEKDVGPTQTTNFVVAISKTATAQR